MDKPELKPTDKPEHSCVTCKYLRADQSFNSYCYTVKGPKHGLTIHNPSGSTCTAHNKA